MQPFTLLPVLSGLSLLVFCGGLADAQIKVNPISLYEGRAPLAKGDAETDKAFIYPYPAPALGNTGATILVIPGGGYGSVAIDLEGYPVATWLNGLGINAFILRYRLGSNGYHHPVELNDAKRGMRWVRAHAQQYGLDTARIGVMGFSAGGHLSATLATHFDGGDPTSTDSLEKQSCHPAFQIVGYPVITMDAAFTDGYCRFQLLGDKPSAALVDSLSNEKQVTKSTPPAFIFAAADDPVVKARNSEEYAKAFDLVGVSHVLKLYDHGPHGFGLANGKNGSPNRPDLATWTTLSAQWLKDLHFLEKPVSVRPSPQNQSQASSPSHAPSSLRRPLSKSHPLFGASPRDGMGRKPQ